MAKSTHARTTRCTRTSQTRTISIRSRQSSCCGDDHYRQFKQQQLPTDSLGFGSLKNKIGDFAYALTLPSATATITTFENEVLALKIDNKGGFISEVKLKSYVNHDSVPVYLIKDGSSVFNLNFATSDNRTLNSTNLYFQPTLSTSGDNQVLSMRLKVSETQFLEYRYELKPNDYMLGFSVKSQGFSNVLNTSQDVQLDWKFKAHRQDQSISFENRYTRLTYQHEGDKINKLSQSVMTMKPSQIWLGFLLDNISLVRF